MKLIRRANLDALWSREPTTVSGNLLVARQGVNMATALGFQDQLFRPMGPFPLEDSFGMAAAIVMLQQSLKPGKYAKTVQFGTARKFRSCFSNIYQATVDGKDPENWWLQGECTREWERLYILTGLLVWISC